MHGGGTRKEQATVFAKDTLGSAASRCATAVGGADAGGATVDSSPIKAHPKWTSPPPSGRASDDEPKL